jgi:acyl-coenzyme A synthetase/AMP-(fatty) acid ligase
MLSLFENGTTTPCPPAFNMAAHVLQHAGQQPDKIALAVVSPTKVARWSYARLETAVRGTATGLISLGLAKGDRVLMRLANTPEFPICYLACIAIGVLPVPTSSQLTTAEITKLAAEINPKLIVAADGVALPEHGAKVLNVAELTAFQSLPPADYDLGDPNRPAYIIYTSGTSGKPRAVVHAHRAFWARQMMWRDWYDLGPDDTMFHAGAFNWTYTLGTGLMDPWTVGATALIPAPGTQASALPALLHRARATIFAAAPGVYRQMLRAPLPPLPHLRHGLSAGEALPQTTRDAWHAATGTPIFEAFGMSEISTFISGSPDRPAPVGSTGYAQPGRQIAVLDSAGIPAPIGTPGILAVDRRDPGLFLGYYRDPAATAARFTGDWYLTGDTAQMAADGAVSYLGRNDDMMNAGGYRVSPLEVEAVMATLSGITDCAAIEVEVKPGTTIIACVYASPDPLLEDALTQHAARSLARYKQPRAYHHMAQLPRNANGKLNRRALRALIAPSTPSNSL